MVVAIALIVILAVWSNYVGSHTIPNNRPNDKDLEKELTRGNIPLDKASTGNTRYIDTPYVKEYSLPPRTWPNGILVDTNGMVWTAGSISHSLFMFDPKQEQIKSFPIKETNNTQDNDSSKDRSLMVWTMVEDNDGFIWFSQFGPDPLWRFDPHTEKFNTFHSISAAPFQMKVDKKTGNIWFTTLTGNTLGVIQKIENKNGPTPTYKVTEFDIGPDTYPSGLFFEEDSIWITQLLKNKLTKFTAVVNGNGMITDVVKMSEIPAKDHVRFTSPTDLLVSKNGTIWLTEHGASFITEYRSELQSVKRFPTSQNAYHVTTLPFWIREGSGGKVLWFNEHTGSRIAFLNITEKTMIEYEIPSRPSDGYVVYPLNIAVDAADGKKLWFSEWNTDKIALLDSSIPVQFDLRSDVDKVILSSNNGIAQQSTAIINLEISKNIYKSPWPANNHNIVFLNASSSMDPAAGLVNMTANFSTDTVDLTKVKETEQVQLLLRNYSASPGNYTLGISATDGTVIKSIFLDLVVER